MTHFLSLHALPTTPLLLLLVLLCPASGHRPSTRDDLDQLILLFTGEFDNNVQNRQDTDSGLPSSEVHTFLRRLHVPVRVLALREASGVRATTRQVYLETYLGETIFPNRQRIFNFVLKDGVIEMETHAPRNASLNRQWERWRVDREIFRDLGADDLAFNPLCNVRWTRDGQSCFSAAILDNNCVFNFAGTQVYIRSKVKLTDRLLSQDEQFLSVADDSVVSGLDTPFLSDRIADIRPLQHDGPTNNCAALTRLTCRALKVALACLTVRIVLYTA